jgi:hypothetical protein
MELLLRPQLTLALLVALDLTDNPHHAVAADDLALLTARLDRSPNLHSFLVSRN